MRTLSLPDQTGKAGLFLQTDGQNLSWASTGGGGGGITSLASGNASLTLTPDPVTTTGTIQLNVANSNVWTALQTFNHQNLLTTVVSAASLTNTQAATNAARVQNSPALLFEGRGWTGSVSQIIRLTQSLKPTIANRFSFSWDGTVGSTITTGLMVLTQSGDLTVIRNLSTNTGSVTANAGILQSGGTIDGQLLLAGSVTGGFTLTVPASTSAYTLTVPTAQGGANEIMVNNGSGILSWSALPTALTLETNGSLNGDQTVLNLINGTNMTITDDGFGNITFDAAAPLLSFAESVVNTANTITLVNDSTTPGINMYYGTDGSGTKGWISSATVTGANAALSNLSGVAINADLLPGTANTINLGNISKNFKTLSLPYGAGTAANPDIYWYDNVHSSKIGLRAGGSTGGLFVSIDSEDCVHVEDNGSTPFLHAGTITEELNSICTYYESAGLQGINDGAVTNGSNAAFSLVGKRAGFTVNPQMGVAPSHVQTTDNTPTLLDTRTLANNTMLKLKWDVTAFRTGGASGSAGDAVGATVEATFSCVAGVITQIGTTSTVINKSNTNCNVTLNISGVDIQLIVTGDTANNYNWFNFTTMHFAK